MKHSLFVAVTATALALCGAGCGSSNNNNGGGGSAGGGSDATCSKVAACGGDPTGSWKISKYCPDNPPVPMEISQLCQDAQLQAGDATATGTVEFKSDGTYTQSSHSMGTGYLILPASCLMQGSQKLSCSQIQSLVSQQSKGVTCASTSDNGCKCTLTVSADASDMGTYKVSGTSMTLTSSSGGMPVDTDFCVKNSDLYMHLQLAAPTDAGVTFDLTGQLVLTK